MEAESSTPISERTRSRQKAELPAPLQAPLRQAVGNSGPVFIKVPFSISDLNNWKLAAGNYREDPEKVASAFEMIVKTQNPDWQDIEAILQVLFDSTEREMIRRAVRLHVEGQIATNALHGREEQHFPLVDPNWDHNNPDDREMIIRYQRLVIFGIRHTTPEAVNWSKLYEIKQNKDESPTDFLNRLKEAARKIYYSENRIRGRGRTAGFPIHGTGHG